MGKNKIVLIRLFENHPFLDKVISIFLKPLIIASLYSINVIMQYAIRRIGIGNKDFDLDLIHQALDNVFKKRGSHRDIVYFYWSWGLNAFTNFLMLDNAYRSMFRKFRREYLKLLEKNKYKL